MFLNSRWPDSGWHAVVGTIGDVTLSTCSRSSFLAFLGWGTDSRSQAVQCAQLHVDRRVGDHPVLRATTRCADLVRLPAGVASLGHGRNGAACVMDSPPQSSLGLTNAHLTGLNWRGRETTMNEAFSESGPSTSARASR